MTDLRAPHQTPLTMIPPRTAPAATGNYPSARRFHAPTSLALSKGDLSSTRKEQAMSRTRTIPNLCIAALAALSAAFPAAAQFSEAEPNDTKDQATGIVGLQPGMTIS